MSIDEASRRELWNSLRDTIGATHADTLMTMLPDQPLPEFATRDDMAALTATLRSEIRAEGNAVRADLRKDFGELRSEFGGLRAEFGELEGGLRAEFGQLEGGLRAEFGELEGGLRAEFGQLEGGLRTEFGELRSEFGELRSQFGELLGEFGQLEGRLRAEFARRTLTLGLTLGSLIIAVLGTILTLGFTGAFA